MKTWTIRARATCAVAACLTLALLVGACGSQRAGSSATGPKPTPTNGVASKTPAQILKATEAALASVTSVHIRGHVRESGHKYTVDLVLGHKTAKGSMTAPLEGIKHASFDFLLVGGRMYIRSSTLWRKAGGPAAANMLDNRWVMLPKGASKGFPFASTKAFTKSFRSGSSEKARSVGAMTTINGQPAVTLITSDSTIYVATTGMPYPLRVLGKTAKQGAVDLFDFNAPVIVTAPLNPIDITKFHA